MCKVNWYQLYVEKGSSIKYMRSEGEGVVELKARWIFWGAEEGGSAVSVCTPLIFFADSLQNRNKMSELFKEPELPIPISPVQLKSANVFPGFFLVFWFDIFFIL